MGGYEHFTDILPTAWCKKAHYSSEAYVPPHFHYMSELLYIVSGSLSVTADDRTVELQVGDAALISFGVMHSTVTRESEFLVCNIPGYILDAPIRGAFGDLSVLRGIGAELHSLLKLLHDSLFCEERPLSDPVVQVMISSLANAIVSTVVLRSEPSPSHPTSGEPFRQMIGYIAASYTDRALTTEALAERFGYTPRMLSELFNANLRVGVKRYIDNLRVNDAMNRLISTGDSIELIAERVGYESVRSFYRIFRKISGMTPGQYRAKR